MISSSKTGPVRFGIVSPGRWGRKLIEAARGSPALSYVGASSRDPRTAAALVSDYGGRAYATMEELFADPAVEAVLLPTPHFLHEAQTLAALAAGKHVFVEKPIAPTVAAGEEMGRQARGRGLVLQVGHQARFTGMARRVRDLLVAGELGRVATIAIAQGYPLLLGADAANWRTQAEHVPGGPLDEFGVHYFELLQFWFGPARRVTGLVNRGLEAGGVPDAVAAVIEYPQGVIASYTAHFVSVGLSRLSLFGTKGALEINRLGEGPCTWQPVSDMATARTGGLPPQPLIFPPPHSGSSALTAELADFAESIREGRPPAVGAEESLATLRVSRAVLAASERVAPLEAGRGEPIPPRPTIAV